MENSVWSYLLIQVQYCCIITQRKEEGEQKKEYLVRISFTVLNPNHADNRDKLLENLALFVNSKHASTLCSASFIAKGPVRLKTLRIRI